MDFEDLFENKNKHHGNYRKHGYHEDDDRHSRHSYNEHNGHNDHQKWLNIWEKIRSNNKLKLLILLAAILILAIIIGLIAILWPLLMKLFNYVSQNGLQGILEAIWKGTGK